MKILIACRMCGKSCQGRPKKPPRTFDGICGDCRKLRTPVDDTPDQESANVLSESGWWNDRGIMRHMSARRTA
jgi:NMD protein affecting ribosome stability and mRNA decay